MEWGSGREAWQLPIRKCRCICAQTANIGTEQSPNYPQADWLGDMTTGHTQREKQRLGERGEAVRRLHASVVKVAVQGIS